MALKRIQDLTNAGSLDGTELVELEKAGSSVKTTTQDIANLSTGGGGDTVTAVSVSGGFIAIDLNNGVDRNFTVSMTANATLTVSNLSPSGRVSEFEAQITQDSTGGRTLLFPSSFKALGGSDTSISSPANSVTVISAKTFDDGVTWRYAMQESA